MCQSSAKAIQAVVIALLSESHRKRRYLSMYMAV